MKKNIGLLVITFAILLIPQAADAQTTGAAVAGIVRNQNGEAIVGATITANSEATNQARAVITDSEGSYRLPALIVGTYKIAVEAAGYNKVIREQTLRVNEEARLDFELGLAGVEDTVNVVGRNAPLTETGTSVLGVVIENKQINDLPLNGRHFLHLGSLVANVNSTPSLRSAAEGGDGNGPFAVAGQRDRALTFLVDGVDNTNSLSGSLTARISLDSIQEFKMITSLASAEYGYHSGGTINIITKSGSNAFHASLFEFLRNDAFNAPNYFEKLAGKSASEFSNHQFGGTVGGPVIKDRTFFLASYEGQRLRAGSAQFSNVPTAAERSGIFRNPFSGQDVQFPVDPLSAEILRRYVPLPNTSSEFGNYISTPMLTARNDYALLRLDHLASGDDVLNARYYIFDSDTFNPINLEEVRFLPTRPPTIPGFGLLQKARTQNLAIAHTHNFSVQTINELRFGYNRYFLDRSTENQDKPSDLGFAGVADSKGLFLISVSGMPTIGALSYPINNRFGNFHISDSLSFMHGHHELKAGGEMRFVRQNVSLGAGGNGLITFSGRASQISPLADFVMGAPEFAIAFERPEGSPMKQTVSGAFIQDDYQVNSRLVLNLGLRYELSTVLNGPTHKLTNFSFERGFFTPGLDTETGLYKGDHNNFAPRVGFAWSLTGDGRTVLRGGYGIFYDTVVHTLAAFQNALYQGDGPFISLSVAPHTPGQLAGVFAATIPIPLFSAYDENMRTPYAQHFNLTLQREIGRTMVLSFGYVGTKGTKLIDVRTLNQAIYIPGTDANGQPLSTPFNLESRRPSQLFHLTPYQVGAIDQLETGASSIYHSFQATVNKRMGHGLSVLGAYTWSKSIDDASDPFGFAGDSGSPQDSNNLRQERALSVFDIRHQLTVGYNYQLPFKGNRLKEGWQINGIATVRSGQPFTAILNFDPSLTGSFFVRPNYAPEAFTNKGGQVFLNRNLPLDPFTGLPAVIVPQTGQFGNLGRNTFTGPGYKNIDVSLVKDTRLGERLKIQSRFEIFNAFNTTNLALPERRLTDPFFGRSTRTPDVAGGVPGIGGGGPRVIQLALKLLF